MPFTISIIVLSIFVIALLVAFLLRRVVPTNEVHIVQSSKKTRSYGKDTDNGNTYYEWPSWVPAIGVSKIILPVSVFDLNLVGYEAYDVGRVPFVVDIVAFFRIADSNLSAQRVESFQELQNQLLAIVQGAVRTILASHDIDRIMLERSIYGEQFTQAVNDQLLSWGVVPVKSIELMDIRDAEGNQVVHNIMEKKKSLIEMESRQEVAENIKNAQIAEINAMRERDIKEQEALQAVGERTAVKTKVVGIADEQASQDIKEQQRMTKEKEMAVILVNDVKRAEIDKEVNVVKADEDRLAMILRAEGHLEAKKKEAEAIQVEGEAVAVAERAMQLAPVQAQIELAKEIGENEGYQSYLINVEAINASRAVGLEQAEALQGADVKVIVNSGDPVDGLTNVMDMFSAKGGTNMAAMLEGLSQTEQGKALMERFGLKPHGAKPAGPNTNVIVRDDTPPPPQV
ncbi:SPFH domain-containing protein [Alphaproteobacteria bacterium]|nr:SPFH domain-containing protein [Alphaproteobacteria bacterium]